MTALKPRYQSSVWHQTVCPALTALPPQSDRDPRMHPKCLQVFSGGVTMRTPRSLEYLLILRLSPQMTSWVHLPSVLIAHPLWTPQILPWIHGPSTATSLLSPFAALLWLSPALPWGLCGPLQGQAFLPFPVALGLAGNRRFLLLIASSGPHALPLP